jgi:hypothetical protein
MHMRVLRIFFISLSLVTAFAVSQSQTPDSLLAHRALNAVRMTNPIIVDGVLNEAEYRTPPHATGFIQRDPDEGKPATQESDVWIAYDDAALYIGAKLHDSAPDSIVSKLSRRDVYLSSDYFYVGIDSYHDHRTGFFFYVFPSGTQGDGTLFNDSWDDNSWDGVWESATMITDEGWNVEMRIPYSQLRFPKNDEYVWGINFERKVERRNEESHWSPIKKGAGIWVSGFGELHGIRNINPPTRLEVLPYFASSAEALVDDPGNPFTKKVDVFGRVGADIKVGLGSNLTLNGTINPDFGQVEVDPAVVNLSQFETFFQEKRPFFIEGSDYFNFGFGGANNNWGFNFGTPDFFYSRRVGRHPQGDIPHEEYDYSDVPKNTSILGAAKLTGRIADGWSLASMQALTRREYARSDSGGMRFRDVVEPFAYYGVIRSLREFENGKHAIGLIGTAAVRDLNQNYLLGSFNKRSFSLGIDGWTHLDSAKAWVISGWIAGSRIEGDPERMIARQRSELRYFQRPDQDYVRVDSAATSLSGYGGRIALNKQSGNFRINTGFGLWSPGFDVNDMGFQWGGDRINGHFVAGYNWFEPDGFFRRKAFNLATARNYNFEGKRVYEVYALFSNVQFMNYWGLTLNFFFNPQYIDVLKTRGGPAMLTTNGYGLYLFANTDQRNDVSFDMELDGGRTESGGYRYVLSPGIEWRPSSGVFLRLSPSYYRDVTIAQWVTSVDDPFAAATYGSRYLFGRLDQQEVSAVFRLNWTFSPTLSLQIFVQPLISVGTYDDFKELRQRQTYSFNRYGEKGSRITAVANANGTVGSYDVDPDGNGGAQGFSFDNPNFNYKSFRGNAILRWEYLPGSTLYFAWTHGRIDERNPGNFGFRRDFNDLFRTEPDNVFLIKVAYWLTPETLARLGL